MSRPDSIGSATAVARGQFQAAFTWTHSPTGPEPTPPSPTPTRCTGDRTVPEAKVRPRTRQDNRTAVGQSPAPHPPSLLRHHDCALLVRAHCFGSMRSAALCPRSGGQRGWCLPSHGKGAVGHTEGAQGSVPPPPTTTSKDSPPGRQSQATGPSKSRPHVCACACLCVCAGGWVGGWGYYRFYQVIPVGPVRPHWRPWVRSLPITAGLRCRPGVCPCMAPRPVRYAL